MFNVAVVNIKDLIKYLVGIIVGIIIVAILTRYFSFSKIKKNTGLNLNNKVQAVMQKSYLECIDNTIPTISEVNSDTKETSKKEDSEKEEKYLQELLQVELAKIDVSATNTLKNDEQNDNQEQVAQEAVTEETNTRETTEVVTPNPIEAIPTDTYGAVKIRNQTGYVLTEEVLKLEIDINKSDIIIFHTHTCESYTPTEENQYEASGSYRTIDLNHSVARVGDELANNLTQNGYNVVHDKTFHDYPSYTGSYARSLKTVEGLMQNTKADVVIDLHRDAIGSNSEYAPTVRIGENYCAQLMFVIGTDGGGLFHPNWNQNLKFAVAVQQKAEELYPGLFKPIVLRNSRYNQHVSKAATIIEVGATGNTLEQSLASMKYLSEIINTVISCQ